MSRYLFDARAHTPHFPGIGRTIAGLLPALVAACAADEEIVAIAPPGDDWPCEIVRSDTSALSVRQHLELPRLIRRVAPQVFHSPYVTVPARPTVPTVVTVNDVIPLQVPGSMGIGRRAAYRLSLHQSLWSADRVLVPSEATAEAVRALRPRRPVDVVPHAVDHEHFRPRSVAEVDEARAGLGLVRPYLLALTSERRHKNRATLLDAWRRLGPVDEELVLVGPGREPGERGVRAVARVDENDLPALYTGAELVVVPSLHEGFGLPVLEAMACGVPVACSAIPVLDEVAGGAAASFDPRQPDELAATLRRLLDDPAERARLAAAGGERAAGFTWAEAARQTLAAYRRTA